MRFLLCVVSVSSLFGLLLALNSGPVNICEDVKDMIFLPYLGNCSRYYVCMGNEPIERPCESGYLFDAKDQSCTYPKEARCLPTCTSALSSFCYDRTCTKYVLCYAGTPIIRQCVDGLQYNAETDRCDYPEYVDCVDNLCTIFNNPSNITYIASKAACEKYYICMDGIAHAQNCSNGLEFNPECNCCDFPSKVNCQITAAQRNIKSFSKAPPRRADIVCPANGVHFIAHHAASDKYYFCMDGSGVILECTPGLVFDPILGSCRSAENIARGNLNP